MENIGIYINIILFILFAKYILQIYPQTLVRLCSFQQEYCMIMQP